MELKYNNAIDLINAGILMYIFRCNEYNEGNYLMNMWALGLS